MIDAFIAHLQATLATTVIYAYTTDPVEEHSEEMPVIMVYPGGLGAEESGVDNFIRQRITQELVCLVGVAIADYETELTTLRNAALGWVNGNSDAVELEGSETIGIKGPYIWVRETFSIQYHITQT